MSEDITRPYELGKNVLLFPEIESVFAGDVEQYARLFVPLISVDLSAVSPELSGWVHLVNPIEPLEDLLGSQTTAAHDGYNCENWISFKVTDNKYEFNGDLNYFELNSSSSPELEDHASRVRSSWHDQRTKFATDGWTRNGGPISKFTDTTWAGNWITSSPPPALAPFDEDTGQLSTADGRKLLFIISAAAWSFCSDGPDEVLLWFDPVDNIAYQTFDWT